MMAGTPAPSAVVTMPGDTPVWLTVKEAAARARCGVTVIYRAVESRRLKASPVNARGDLRFRPSWVDAWLDGNAEGQESPR